MTCLVVIDTNVLVSAAISKNPSSPPTRIVERLMAGDARLVYSDEIITEYDIVLRRRKFRLDESFVNSLIDHIKRIGLRVCPESLGMELPDIKDLPFYEVVMEKREDGAYLVTGNTKHFPRAPFIVTPREFLELMNFE